MLCDSNILIYAADPNDAVCRQYTEHERALISCVTRIEVLGFPGFQALTAPEQEFLNSLVDCICEAPLDEGIIRRWITLRQSRKMKLGDAIIAATALEYRVPVVTRNAKDFENIAGLRVINPFDAPEP